MLHKNFSIKLNHFKNAKLISINNNTLIFDYNHTDMNLNVLLPSFIENFNSLQPIGASIHTKRSIIYADIITMNNDIIVYALTNDSFLKYVIEECEIKSGNKYIGNNVTEASLNFDWCCNPNCTITGMKVSKNNSIICLTTIDGDIQIYNIKKLFESKVFQTVFISTKQISVKVNDISFDGNFLILKSEDCNTCDLWNIKENRKTMNFLYTSDNNIVDLVFGEPDCISQVCNIYAIFNSNVGNDYWIVVWNGIDFSIKSSICVKSKLSNSICVSDQTRYLAVNCFDDHSIDLFTSFNLQKLYTYSHMKSNAGSCLCIFLPLDFSLTKLQHEFDFLSLDMTKETITMLYEPLRNNYSIIYPVCAAVIFIIILLTLFSYFGF